MIKKSKYIYFIFLIAAILLSGCGVRKNSAPPSKAEVQRAVAEEVAGEEVTLDHVEHLDQIPHKDIYYYTSEDRDLTFEVESYVRASDIGIGGSPIYVYQREIEVKYWDAVKEYYAPKMEEIFSGATKSGIRYLYTFHNFEELTVIIDKILEAENCYAEEREYHDDAEWFRNHVVVGVELRWENEENSEENSEDGSSGRYQLFSSGYLILADADTENTYEKICASYVGAIMSGKIASDDTVPEELLAMGHIDQLTVFVNGTEMTDELSYMLDMTPTVALDGVFYAEYNYDYGCYMMRIDPGCGSKTGRSHPLQALVKAAGGTGGDLCNNLGKEEWTIRGDHFVIKADRDMGSTYIRGVTLTKNGEPVDITYTNRTDLTRSSDMVFISVEDIATMLELTVTVDEENGVVIFE